MGAALAALGAWYFALRDTAEPVSVEEAVTRFRTETEATPSARSPIREGVYVYATDGFERTDAHRGHAPLPARSTITVAAHDCGVSLTWRVLRGRSTEWVYCVDPGWLGAAQPGRAAHVLRTYGANDVHVPGHADPARTRDPSGDVRRLVLHCVGEDEHGAVLVVGRRTLRVEAVARSTPSTSARPRPSRARSAGRAARLWFDERPGCR